MAGLYSKFKSAIGLGSDSSQSQADETNADRQTLALDASKVSADLKNVVGVGSLGTVYTGEFMGKKCAVKVYNIGVVQKEALQMRGISSIIQQHTNVVLVHGLWYGTPENYLPNNDPALVMEHCSMSLDGYLNKTRARGDIAVFRLVTKREILSDVASGMAYLHSKGIVHGGLSAREVLLNFTGPTNDPKILAKVAGVHEMKLFNQDTVMKLKTSDQRRRIMPPEVKDGGEDGELTKPVDLFSFGCLIVHVVSCVNPVPSMEAGLNEFQKRSQYITGNQTLLPLMKRCLDENPMARGTFEEVEKDLSVHQSGNQAQKQEVDGIREVGTLESEVNQPKVPDTFTAETGGSPNTPAEVLTSNVLPSESVIVKKQNKVVEGSFAKVYKGEYQGKPCAVKVYKEGVLKRKFAPGPTDKHHIALTAVKHANIVQMYGIWYYHHKSKVLPSIVMELCEESLLEAFKKWKKTSPGHKQKLLIQRDIAVGMVYLHSQYIIHGNLHSGNVLLCQFDGRTVAKVSDFDMNYRDLSTQSRLTSRFQDDHFLPPEMLECKDPKERWALLTPKVDVFCFGELALEMANGSYPTPEKKVQGYIKLTEVQRREKHLTKLGKSDRENLDSIIRKCISDTPESRPSFSEIISDMDRHLQKYGERPDCAMLQKRAIESEALGAQALGKADSKSSSDMQERKKDLRSGSPQQVIYDTSVDSPPLVSETSDVPADRASSLDTGVQSKATPDPFPLSLESSLVTYDDMKVIGQGSFATVYRGMYKEKECAIKVFKNGMVRFLKGSEGESQLASIVRHHPNVVLVHGLLYIANRFPDDQPALVMELCNTTLRAYLQGKVDKAEDESFETSTKLVVLRDIAAGMIYLHSEHIVHGDLSANNVLLNVNESKVIAKVAGFGQSRLLNAQTVTNSARRDIMPPEVNRSQNQLEPTKPVDVFSFGCLIPHVASCFYPDLDTDCQVGTSEFQKRAKYISVSREKHVFCPLMEKCLKEIPEARGTFEEVIAHLNKYSKREQAQIVEEREIEKLRSQLQQLQRAHENLQEELAAEKETCSEAKRHRDTLEKEKQQMEQKLNDVVTDNEQHRSLTVEGIFKTYAAPKDVMKRLEDQVKKQDSDMKLLQQQHTESVIKCDKFCRENNDLQNEVRRLSSELETLQREKGGIVGEKSVIEELKKKADRNVTELQNQLQACQQKCEKTEGELRDCSDRVRLLTADNLTKSNMVSRLEEGIASRDQRLSQARAFKERVDKEREAATVERERAKKETKKLKEEFEKETRTFQAKIASYEKTNSTQQEKLSDAQKKEQTLNDQLREYRDKLKTTEGARDRFERSMVALKEEVAVRDKQVRELTTELALRNGDLDKKEKELFTTKKDLVDAQAAVEEGKSLEPKLREKIEELEDKNKELMDDLEKTLGKLKNVQKKLTEAMDTQNVLENEQEQQDETIRELEGIRDRLSDRVQALESELSEKEAFCEELEKKCHEEAQNCQLMERERDHAREQADEVRRQAQEFYKEHDSLRTAHTQAQQGKKELSKQVMEYEQQMKAERAATAKERDSTSLELVALRQEKRHLEENLEAKHQDLMSKQEELNVAESYVLGLQQRIEDLQEEYEVLQSDRQEKVHKLNELAPQCEEVERQHAEEAEKCRFWKGECDRFALTVGHLERTRCQMEAHTQELEKQQIEEAEKCHRLKDERDSALKKADNLREQCDTLHRDIETLRKTLQNKTKLNLELRQCQEEMKAKLTDTEQERDSASLKLVALRQEKGRVEEHLQATSQDLKSKHEELMVSEAERAATAKERDSISLELVALRQEKRHLEENLKAKHQDLMSKQEELNVAESCVLGLQQRIEDLQEEYEVLQSDRQEKVHKLNELAPRCEEVERQHAEEAEKCRFWKGECDRFALTVGHLEKTRCQMEAHTQELEKQQIEEAEKCHRLKDERDSALKKADNLREQCDTLHRDIETLRKTLQNKTKLDLELRQCQEEMKAKLAATEQERDSTSLELVALRQEKGRVEEYLEATSQDLKSKHEELMVSEAERAATAKERDSISLELVALRQEKRHLEENLEAKHQDLMSKQEELNVAESCVLGLQQRIEDLQEENEMLQSDRQEKVHKLNELAPRCEEVERQYAEAAEKWRFWKGECDRFALKVGHLERTRCQMEAHTQELEKQQVEEAEKCHRLEDERDNALKKADNLREQLDALHKDIETLRKTLQNKTKLNLELRQCQEEMKAKLTDTEQERDSTSLELVALRQENGRVEEHMEATSQELMVSVSKCNKLESSREKLECLFTEMATKNEALQEQLDEATEKCHAMETECKRLTSSVEELETELNDVTVRSEELREQLDDKLEMCRLMERGRAIELQRAEELQKQRDEMYRDHESLRKKLNADLQKKMDLIQELAQSEQQMKTARDNAINRAGDLEKQLADLHMDHEKLRGVQVSELQGKTNLIEELMESERQNEADLISADRDYQALKAKLEATAEDASKDKTSLVRVSSELEAMKRDLENSEKQLEDARQCLKEKVEECKAFEREKQQLAVEVMQKEAELATLEAERSALRGQLKDFAVIKAENESLKNDAEERTDMMRQCEDKSRRLARLEERLNKERMDLTTERRLFMEQKKKQKKMNTDFARSRNLESIVKRSVQESFELLNASGREMSESGRSEGSPDSALPESPIRRDMQNSGTIVEGKQEVEEAWRQEKREIQRQLDRARRENKQLKDAERKAQDSSEEMHELAQTYFLSHRYPPFLYQLHQLQKHLHSSGVQGISTLGDGRTVEVTRVTDLRSFTRYESWCDEFQLLIDELKAMPSKQCQAYMLISFLHCGEVITFYRFHVALVPQVLSCERDLHPNELEGDAMPKAMLVYAHTELKSNNLKEFGITPHRKGVLLQPQCEGYVPELTRSQLLRKLKDTPAGLKHTEECLDANILHQLQRQYREFAKPRTAHRGPPMGVAMALI